VFGCRPRRCPCSACSASLVADCYSGRCRDRRRCDRGWRIGRLDHARPALRRLWHPAPYFPFAALESGTSTVRSRLRSPRRTCRFASPAFRSPTLASKSRRRRVGPAASVEITSPSAARHSGRRTRDHAPDHDPIVVPVVEHDAECSIGSTCVSSLESRGWIDKGSSRCGHRE